MVVWTCSHGRKPRSDIRLKVSCHVETVCLLTHKDWKGLGKAWNQGVSVTRADTLRVMGALLLFSAETYPDFLQRQGCGYDFTFFGNESTILLFRWKRVNDFTIWGRLWLWFYWEEIIGNLPSCPSIKMSIYSNIILARSGRSLFYLSLGESSDVLCRPAQFFHYAAIP